MSACIQVVKDLRHDVEQIRIRNRKRVDMIAGTHFLVCTPRYLTRRVLESSLGFLCTNPAQKLGLLGNDSVQTRM